jgi:hypothetical protein
MFPRAIFHCLGQTTRVVIEGDLSDNGVFGPGERTRSSISACHFIPLKELTAIAPLTNSYGF